jgi:hypothetical protein
VCSSVGVWVCVFGILITLHHHIITSFHITLHHTSYCVNGTRIEYEANLRQMLRQIENVLRYEVSFEKYRFISLLIRRDLFFLRSMKRRECVFSPKAQKRYVCKFHASQRNKLQQSTYLIQYYTLQILHSFVTIEA